MKNRTNKARTDAKYEDENVRVWGFHATEDPQLPIKKNCIACGWEDVGDLSELPHEQDAFLPIFMKRRERHHKSVDSCRQGAGTLLRFAWEAKVGDCVVYPVSNRKDVYIGRIKGVYRFDKDSDSPYKQVRDVEWTGPFSRDDFTPGAQTAMGGRTFWAIGRKGNSTVTHEFLAKGGFDVPPLPKKSHEVWVKENLYRQLSGVEFEDFVAVLFHLYGYETDMTAKSGDHGIDIIATRTDALCTQTLLVQVKRHKDGVSEADVQRLFGSLADYPTARGVFVAYGGLQNSAADYAEKHGITVIDGHRICTLALWNETRLAKDAKWAKVFKDGID